MISNEVTLLSEISNLMAFAKNFHTGKLMLKETLKSKFAALIDDCLAISDDNQEIRLLKFLLEQLELMTQNKHSRRYSPCLLMISYIIRSTSARAYERLLEEQVLMLPSARMAVRYGTFRICVLRTLNRTVPAYRTSAQFLKRTVPTYRTRSTTKKEYRTF